ncbi:glycerate kinase family protein [Prevotella sp.]|uniref:glycerate kinase family protein n=1 Tax=Prevotella sp. TaxID=59823 RepID=UPI0025E4E498|nr:glycerate kinase [Prevotella sp.]
MKTILAIDSFKGCMSSSEVEETIAGVLDKNGVETLCLPMSDGGEGMLQAFTSAMSGTLEPVYIHDQMMRRVDAQYGVMPDGTAIIEVAQACGLTLVKEEERNPMRSTTYGVGELLSRAIKRGCRNFIIGLGGTGTSDAGIGMIRALVDIFARGKNFDEALKTELGECRFTLASDVDNPLCGKNGAAHVFAPQKGATPEMVEQLDRRARLFAEKSALHFGFDKSNEPGAGAAGGLGYAFMQYLGAEMKSGADLLLDLTDFNGKMKDADLIITGEGSADRQTLMGKLPQRILMRGKQLGVPVGLVAGRVEDREELLSAGFSFVESITPEGMPLEEAIKKEVAFSNLRRFATSLIYEKT